jgi:hypothetical protein
MGRFLQEQFRTKKADKLIHALELSPFLGQMPEIIDE